MNIPRRLRGGNYDFSYSPRKHVVTTRDEVGFLRLRGECIVCDEEPGMSRPRLFFKECSSVDDRRRDNEYPFRILRTGTFKFASHGDVNCVEPANE